ncbi:flagellar hook-associated protein FlgK [Lederbergia panacisoli]|uniref:flagellar hook-associated protein FlgK n=1 Tax=Lederbergia panacisoli TaxID=1255251 RepID=UPI00214CD3DB|nr:flagellar hook-associated protein FlgK [Lederbergia panacisoli]MCR2822359.1 flagellar hook-associated protein FlgK [Lederbergia panacisoli]
MRSTFMGLETAKRGMYTQQSAIHVTGHNIANKNTPGYTRQRVNFVQSEPYPAAAMNRPQIPGQVGTGVHGGVIERIRDTFVDEQFRTENNKLGYYESMTGSIAKMEDIMNEPSDVGLSKAMAQFWQSLQSLSTNPENEGSRRVVIQRATSVAETFNYLYGSLTTIKNDMKKEIDITLNEINAIATDIASINKQISEIEPHGYLPNDLYDERDRLMDQLSKLVPIEAESIHYGGNSLSIAEGGRNVSMIVNGEKVLLVDDAKTNQLEWDNTKEKLLLNNKEVSFDSLGEGKGKMSALFHAHDIDYPDMLADLDKYAYTFAQVFNEVHSQGHDLNGDPGAALFDVGDLNGAAGRINVIITDPAKIAAALQGTESGNGGNALNLAKIKDLVISGGVIEGLENLPTLEIKSGTMQSFYEGVIGAMAVKGQHANRLQHNTNILVESVSQTRSSISEVSLDEEFSNLIQYQHAYSASARMISVIDEMLDKIINGMGTAGR